MRLPQLYFRVRLSERARLATFAASRLVMAILMLGFAFVSIAKDVKTGQLTSSTAHAATSSLSRQIPLTARLIDPTTRLPVANGTYTIRFAIYSIDRTTSDAFPSDSDSSSRLWTETKDIVVRGGIISTSLGSSTPLTTTIDFSSNDSYLGIRIKTDPELVPRRKLGTVPSAISADNLQGKIPGFDANQIPYTNLSGVLGLTNGLSVSSAPTASATTSLIRLGSALSGGSLSGTYLGANATAGYSGNFIDLQSDGVSKFRVDSTGQIIAGSISPSVLGSSAVTSIAKTGGTARTGAITFTPGSSITIADNGDNTFTIASTASSSATTLQGAYDVTSGSAIVTTDARDIDITLANTTTDANLDIQVATGSSGFVSISRVDGAGATDPAQLLLVDNLDTDRAQPIGLKVQSTAGGLTTAIDLTDADIGTAIAIGSNDITTGATTISSAELDRLDGKDTALIDTNDAVTTAITGVGTIGTGVWQGTAIGATYGGTGIDTSALTGVATVSTGTWSISASVGPTQGGTGQTTVTTGDLLYGSATNTWSKLAGVATGSIFISGGIGVAPSWSATPTLTTSLTVPTILTSASDFALQASTGIVNLNKASVQNKLRVFESAVSPTKYTEVTHDGTNGKVSSSSGELQLAGNGTNQLVVGSVGTAVNLVFEENSSILGQGTNTITLGQSGDTFNLNTAGVTYNIGTLTAGAAILNTTTTGSTALKVNAATGQTGLLLDLQVNGTSKASIDANGLITSVGLTSSGTNTISTSSANALALTGTPATSATSSLLQLGSAIASGSSNGTYAGINSGAGFTGNFLDYQVNGTSRFYISNTGAISIAETTSTGTGSSITANSLTTGDGLLAQTSSLTTGNLVSLSSTSTAAASNTQTVLKVSTSGVNSTSTQTSYGFYATNTHSGTASTNIAGYFAASGGTVNIAAQFDGHIKSTQTTAPTIGTPTNCGTTPTTAVTTSSTDSAGSFTITAGTGSPTTCDTIITFNNAFGAAPKSIILTPSTLTGGAKNIYVSATATTTFTVKLATSPAASEVNTWYYQIIE